MENASPTRTIRFTDEGELNRFVSGLPETLAEALWRDGLYQCPARTKAFPLDTLRSLSVPLARDLRDAAAKSRKTGVCGRVFLRTADRTSPVAELLVALPREGERRDE